MRRLVILFGLLLLTGCATGHYAGSTVADAAFLQRAESQTQGNITVRAAVPDAAETQALTGLDLYARGIQPLWLEISNDGDEALRTSLWSIDRDYYSPLEVAYMHRKQFSSAASENVERWFYENGLERFVPPGETRSGLVFTHLREGTKGFNLDLFAPRDAYTFTFFLALPGFTPDYMTVDFEGLYTPDELVAVGVKELLWLAEKVLPCCSSDVTNREQGDPFNLIFVGTPDAVRRSLLRGGWLETAADAPDTQSGRTQHYRGRSPDGIFRRARPDGAERLELRIWLAPALLGIEPVWVAQAVHEVVNPEGNTEFMPDIDAARRMVMQTFWYNLSLRMAGRVRGVGPARADKPQRSFSGMEYYGDGLRTVLFLSEDPVAMTETKMVDPDGDFFNPDLSSGNAKE